LIYYVDGVEPYRSVLKPIVSRVQSAEAMLYLSVVSEIEAYTRPLREGRHEEMARIEDFLAEQQVHVLPVTRGLAQHAGEIRARHRLNVPDAIIIATADAAGCDVIVGNDRKWRGRTGVPFLFLEEMISGR